MPAGKKRIWHERRRRDRMTSGRYDLWGILEIDFLPPPPNLQSIGQTLRWSDDCNLAWWLGPHSISKWNQ